MMQIDAQLINPYKFEKRILVIEKSNLSYFEFQVYL
jgi:hypothetical protein